MSKIEGSRGDGDRGAGDVFAESAFGSFDDNAFSFCVSDGIESRRTSSDSFRDGAAEGSGGTRGERKSNRGGVVRGDGVASSILKKSSERGHRRNVGGRVGGCGSWRPGDTSDSGVRGNGHS